MNTCDSRAWTAKNIRFRKKSTWINVTLQNCRDRCDRNEKLENREKLSNFHRFSPNEEVVKFPQNRSNWTPAFPSAKSAFLPTANWNISANSRSENISRLKLYKENIDPAPRTLHYVNFASISSLVNHPHRFDTNYVRFLSSKQKRSRILSMLLFSLCCASARSA